MRIAKRKVSDMTIDELKTVIHNVISEDLETWRETLEILSDKKLMRQIKQSDADWLAKKKNTYIPWEKIKRV